MRVRMRGWRVACGALGALLASLALAGPAAASPGATASIVGGTTALSEEWPWAAFILAADAKGEGFSCSGTVISPDLILTAGHCVEDIETGKKTPPAQYVVVTGSSDIRDSTLRQVSKVSRTIIYPTFNRFKVHGDAGLLVLATPTTVPAVALAGSTDAALLAPNTPTWIAGWGLSGTLRKLKRTPVLRRGATFVQERLYCRNHARAAGLLDRHLPRRQRRPGARLPRRRDAGADRDHEPGRGGLRHAPARHLHPDRPDLSVDRRTDRRDGDGLAAAVKADLQAWLR